MKSLAIIMMLLNASMAKTLYEMSQSYNRDAVDLMMTQIRRDGDDEKTWVLAYGDSITDGFGASDMRKMGYTNLLKESLKLVHPTFDLVQNSAGFRNVNKAGDRPCERDAYCQEALKLNVSAVTLFIGTNDCKNRNWNEANFKRDYLELC